MLINAIDDNGLRAMMNADAVVADDLIAYRQFRFLNRLVEFLVGFRLFG